MQPRLLVISPVRNEAAHIERVVRSVAAQLTPPATWLVCDDASTDETLPRLQALSRQVAFMRVLPAAGDQRASPGRDRLAAAADARAFNRGLRTVDWRTYTHIMKLDGDIELDPSYMQRLLERFAEDPGLGIAGGVLDEPLPRGGLRRVRIPRHHVHGALKCYSRDCFAALGGIQERLAWDTIDETYARMHGYRTASFPDLVGLHLRPCATADGVLRGRARHGECAYISHYPPMWVALRSLKVASSRPYGISGLAFLYGYARAGVGRSEQVPDSAYRTFTRRELRGRMARFLLASNADTLPGS